MQQKHHREHAAERTRTPAFIFHFTTPCNMDSFIGEDRENGQTKMAMTIAKRNRQIKQILGAKYGRVNVRVDGQRGTAYGYVRVYINATPLDNDARLEMERECFTLLSAANIDLGRRYTDDTCDTTCSEVSIRFNNYRYQHTHRTSDGALWAQIEYQGDFVRVDD